MTRYPLIMQRPCHQRTQAPGVLPSLADPQPGACPPPHRVGGVCPSMQTCSTQLSSADQLIDAAGLQRGEIYVSKCPRQRERMVSTILSISGITRAARGTEPGVNARG
jgi:hypothetical protein